MDGVVDAAAGSALTPEPAEQTPAFVERAPGLSWRRTASGVVVIAPGSAVACALHGPLAELWETLERPTVVDAADTEVRHLVANGLVREGEHL